MIYMPREIVYSSETVPTKYVGWIRANRKDKYLLETLGCEGPMQFHYDGDEPSTKIWIPKTNIEKNLLAAGMMEPTKLGPTFRELYGYEGHFSHCEFKTLDMIKHANECWPRFYAGAFTAVDEKGVQLISAFQEAYCIKQYK